MEKRVEVSVTWETSTVDEGEIATILIDLMDLLAEWIPNIGWPVVRLVTIDGLGQQEWEERGRTWPDA